MFRFLKYFLVIAILSVNLFNVNDSYSYAGSEPNCSFITDRDWWGNYGSLGATKCNNAQIAMQVFSAGIISAAAVQIAIAYQRGEADSAAQSVDFCSTETWPSPLTDSQIRSILLASNAANAVPTVEDIIDKYDKVCLKDSETGDVIWLADDECDSLNGKLICAYQSYAANFICSDIVEYCVCTIPVQKGSLQNPEYLLDDKGIVKSDEYGNPLFKDKVGYDAYFAKHCSLTREIDGLGDLMPFEYTGIIDDICNGWSGYSKNSLALSSGVIQCLLNTVQNIFDKPIEYTSQATSSIALDDEQKKAVNDFDDDLLFANQSLTKVYKVINQQSTIPAHTNPEITNINSNITDMINLTAFNSDSSLLYDVSVLGSAPFFIDDSSNTTALRDLQLLVINLDKLKSSISDKKEDYLIAVQELNSADNSLTMFQNLQSLMKAMSLVIIVLYVTLIGLKIINGQMDVSTKSIFGIVWKISFVYYFAMGNAWRQYFFDMIFDASFGVSELVFNSLDSTALDNGSCSFTQPYYIPKTGEGCSFPNPSAGGSLAPFHVANDPKTGNPILGCLKGPFITMPNYKKPYKAVSYLSIDPVSGLSVSNVITMHCNKIDGTTYEASLSYNPVTKEPLEWTCKAGDALEEGYRISELKKIGFKEFGDINEKLLLIKTAVMALDDTGSEYDIYDLTSSSADQIKEKLARDKKVITLESIRSYENKTHRSYPVIERYGNIRDMSYIGLFDMLDCKVLNYFQHKTVDNSFGLFTDLNPFYLIIAGGVLGIVVFVLFLVIALYLAGLLGHIVQSYLIAMFAIMVLTYMSPIIMPLTMFDFTKGIGKDWIDKIIGYATFPAVLFMGAAIAFTITDYVFWGPSSKFISESMFTDNFTIDSMDCWANDIGNAPPACLLSKLKHHIHEFKFLGIPLASIDAIGINVIFPALLLALSKGIFIIIIATNLIDKFQEAVKKIMNINADVSLEGSIFNGSKGVLDLAKKAFDMFKKQMSEMASSMAKGAAKGGKGGGK